jgi:hypothetical protein
VESGFYSIHSRVASLLGVTAHFQARISLDLLVIMMIKALIFEP